MGIDIDSELVCGWKIDKKALFKYLRELEITYEFCENFTDETTKNPCACGSYCWSSSTNYNAPDHVEIINVEPNQDGDIMDCEYWISLVDDNGVTLDKASQVNTIMSSSDEYEKIQEFVEKLGGDSSKEPTFYTFYTIS
jgi:hypothetical protein